MATAVQKPDDLFLELTTIAAYIDMRWLFSFLALALVGLVQALSSSGNRLLVVVEEAAEKAKYSTFWSDLEGNPSFN